MSDRDDEELKWLRKNEIKMASSQLLEELIPVFKECFEGTIALIKDNQMIYYMPNGQKFEITAKDL